MGQNNSINTKPQPNCILCGKPGLTKYQNLQDCLFKTPGRWDFKSCTNPGCGSIWLDPMPCETDLSKLYQTYYTHKQQYGTSQNRLKCINFLYSVLKTAWGVCLHCTPIYRERRRLFLMYLENQPPGKLLEVGCGNGRRLMSLRALGWQTLGQEVDTISAELAEENYNLEVKLGLLENLGIAEETFDAVIMNHVIEHVTDPKKIMGSCRKLLKPGGQLIVVTPNLKSLGHKLFGRHWLGLDPPRHLHLFSSKTLLNLAENSGFHQCRLWTSAANAQVFASASFDILREGQHNLSEREKLSTYVFAIVSQTIASIIHQFNKNTGEECILVAEK